MVAYHNNIIITISKGKKIASVIYYGASSYIILWDRCTSVYHYACFFICEVCEYQSACTNTHAESEGETPTCFGNYQIQKVKSRK